MAPERRLIIPEEEGVPPSRVRFASHVTGIVPRAIHVVLSSPVAATRPRGRVDDRASGLSFLAGTTGEDEDERATVWLWEHATQTLREDLAPPPGPVVQLVHPEHRPVYGAADGVAADNDGLLVACVGPDVHGDCVAASRGRAGAPRHVYAASPATGVLCYWALDASRPPSRIGGGGANDEVMAGAEPDASVRLRLWSGEVLTSLVPACGSSSGGGGESWLLVATSAGRVWKVYRTSRPPTLHAKPAKMGSIGEGGGASTEEERGSIVRGFYNYFTTPSKASSHHEEGRCVDAAADVAASDDDEAIVALVLVPLSSEEGGDGFPRSPPRKGRHPPRKQQRIAPAPCARALTLSSSLVAKEWRVSLSSGSGPGSENDASDAEEGCLSKRAIFLRRDDGTLDLESLRSEESDDLVGYRSVDLLAPPAPAPDGRSVLAAVRVGGNDPDAARAYVVRIGLGSSPGEGGALRVLDAAWLNRHAGRSLAPNGGTIECVGLATAEEVEGEGLGGVVAFVAFGPRADVGVGGGGRPLSPVIVSAVHFPPLMASAAGGQPQRPRVKDLDLYSNIVPFIVKDSVSYDSLTGGCVMLATSGLLAGASVRFPPNDADTPRGEESLEAGLLEESLAHDETLLTIKSHLQSAFRQYLHKLREGGGGNTARGVIPPSVGTCTSQVLSAAAVLASKDFICAVAAASPSPFSPRSNASPVAVLQNKLQTHRDFVTFLAHAGAYRRVSAAGRARLRDHGEIINAARALLIECQSYFSNAAAAAAQDDGRLSELEQARQMVMNALEGTSDDVIALPHSWARLQQQLPDDNNGYDHSPLEKDLFLLTSSSICRGIGQALRYRQNESGVFYDIPSYGSSQSSRSQLWTSSSEVLEVLFRQLQAIQYLGESILSASLNFETDKANLRQFVEDISASALSGHRDAFLRRPDDEEVTRSYEETKILSVSLLRQYANDDGDDLLALQSSLAHSFFEGIVQICHDHKQNWQFQGPFSDREADERYDLRPMLANMSSASPYAHLHQSRDYQNGLPFCGYVLRWHADRGLYPDVFELGKNCPHDLTRYVRNDDRIADFAWIQQLRVGGDQQASAGLLSLNSPVLFGDIQNGGMGLWEKDQLTSLAKLSNKLASAKATRVDVKRNDLIENTLTLISAQRILQENTTVGDEIALEAEDLLMLATDKIASARDVDEIKRFGICGLAVASAKPPGQNEAMADDASAIWHALIQADIHTWKSVANENSSAVGGISDEELFQCVDRTAFVGVMYDFATTSPREEKMGNVGFLHDGVRYQVLHALGYELTDLLARVVSIVVRSKKG